MLTDEQARLKELEHEELELRRTNEILCIASAVFAQAELDHDQSDGGLHQRATRYEVEPICQALPIEGANIFRSATPFLYSSKKRALCAK